MTPHLAQVYGVYDEKCPISSGYGRPEEHLPYVVLEHCPCTDLFSFLVPLPPRFPLARAGFCRVRPAPESGPGPWERDAAGT
jgi:hypothetical protein